ncbi:MAG: hypothetical protein FJZ75_02745 [Bacteroidetes bacterium]|nr:hypothetical protein [Bacteroidota bacterium]
MPPLKVVLPEPHFVDPDVLGFVNKYPSYQLPQPRMSTESNVFVSHYGLVSKYGWLNRHCMPNLFPPNDISQFWSFQKKVAFQEAVCRFGSSLKVKNLGPAHSYLLIHHKWFGYFFWMTCYMPRLLICIVGPPPEIGVLISLWQQSVGLILSIPLGLYGTWRNRAFFTFRSIITASRP